HEVRCARGELSVRLAGGIAQEILRALYRTCGGPGPDAGPSQVRYGHHGLLMDLLVGDRQDLVDVTLCLQGEAGTAGAAHSERVPGEERLERVVLLEKGDQHLIRCRGIGRAPRNGDNAVGLGTVGDHCRTPLEADPRTAALHRRRARANVAATLTFGGR